MPVVTTDSGATFSACRRWRYLLWRRWDEAKPVANFLMLNPSTADEKQLARTIARYGRVDLLCIDELGYMELDRRGAELLFQVLTEREADLADDRRPDHRESVGHRQPPKVKLEPDGPA